MSFTTVNDVSMFLNQDENGLSPFELDQVSAMVLYVDGIINNYCGWTLLSTSYVEKRFNGNGLSELDLTLYPITALTSVKLLNSDGTFTDLTTDMEILEDGIIGTKVTSTGVTFASGTRNVYVSFTAGFTEDNMPEELKYAATYLAGIMFKKSATFAVGIDEGEFDKVRAKYSSNELPVLVQRVLDRYRKISIY